MGEWKREISLKKRLNGWADGKLEGQLIRTLRRWRLKVRRNKFLRGLIEERNAQREKSIKKLVFKELKHAIGEEGQLAEEFRLKTVMSGWLRVLINQKYENANAHCIANMSAQRVLV